MNAAVQVTLINRIEKSQNIGFNVTSLSAKARHSRIALCGGVGGGGRGCDAAGLLKARNYMKVHAQRFWSLEGCPFISPRARSH